VPAGAPVRAVVLLARLGEEPTELTVADLASATGMPTSTAYRLLAERQRHGLVRRRTRSQRRSAAARAAHRAATTLMAELAVGGGDGYPERTVRTRGDRAAHLRVTRPAREAGCSCRNRATHSTRPDC
jgi:IclR helix-turn-helix domain